MMKTQIREIRDSVHCSSDGLKKTKMISFACYQEVDAPNTSLLTVMLLL